MGWHRALLLLGLLCSCNTRREVPGAGKLSDLRGFCDEWATRACNDTVVEQCSAASKNACIQGQQAFCETLIPESKYSELTASDCLDAVEAAYKDAVLTADERDTVVHLAGKCSKIVSGSGGAGRACTVDGDCNRDEDLS